MRVMNGLLNFTTEETKLFFSAKKRIWAFLCILGVLCGESLLHAQKRLVLDLNRTIALANDSSGVIPYTEYVLVRLLGVQDI